MKIILNLLTSAKASSPGGQNTGNLRIIAAGHLSLTVDVDVRVRELAISTVTIFFKHSVAIMGPFV
jgi:hypothetical protein